MYNKEMYQLHQKLYTNYNCIEIEEMRKEFGEKYIEKIIRKIEDRLNKKLKKLIEETGNKNKEKK